MTHFIRQRERVTVTEARHDFDDPSCPGAGWSFSVDPVTKTLEAGAATANYVLCKARAARGEIVDAGIDVYTRSFFLDAILACNRCRRQVELSSGFANACVCGVEYNGFGQELAPRRFWGEETGESF